MKTFISSFTFVVLVFISEISSAQITFQKTYGDTLNDYGYSVQQTTDGGYIIAGSTGISGTYLVKTDSAGNILWTKTYGPPSSHASSVQQTTDGGYIVAGSSFIGPSVDVYVIKTDSTGDVTWAVTHGSSFVDLANSVQQTTDGGYIVAGWTVSTGVLDDFFIIKLQANGVVNWIKKYDYHAYDEAYSVQQTTDGGYIVGGWTNNGSASEIYLIKTDSFGSDVWGKRITAGTLTGLRCHWLRQTTDGGYIITGIGGNAPDVVLVKTDSLGNSLWAKSYGGAGTDEGNFVQQTDDGGYIIAGNTSSFGAGHTDVYLIKTDSAGDTLWTKTFGGPKYDFGKGVHQTTDRGYIIAGTINAVSGDSADLYLIKTDSLGNSGCNEDVTSTVVTAISVTTIITSPQLHLNNTITNPIPIVGSGGIVTTLCSSVNTTDIPLISNSQLPISISPNPFHTSTTISLNENFSSLGLTFEIFNVEGKMLRQVPIISHETIMERKGLAAGVYFYQLTGGGNVKSIGKLLVQ